ncbi:di-heme oxidoredictase family protein [Pseudoalteromonas denitrificans]|uniref:CxxC motif-containing protein, DUF1111 family n=1 Tax=Pseudoalteromonas denitrificans DSM 6059 TaxID=1123010 RepID=A0A1I1ED71_9GAMM|nr:di-heme oxidoredictase family protein [Pseudoalteromonas denitrificans]SFB82930.1 CxxC motif-containing protein, DUF1111 family [Pseudoalteromonas denitrificans DSM 6059]
MKKHIVTLCILSSVFISACGGSGSSSDNSDNSNNNGNTDTNGGGTTVVLPGQPKDGLAPISAHTPDKNEHLSGGEVSTNVFNQDAFSQSAKVIQSDFELEGVFKAGDQLFRTLHDGQGPLFNNATCQGCHIKDGRGEVPRNPSMPMTSMFLRISDDKGTPDIIYGDQIQTFGTVADHNEGALPKYNGALNEGLAYGEAYAFVEYEVINGQFNDGEAYQLRKPIYKVKDLSYGDFNDSVRLSPRVSPSVFGSGLLHAIPEDYITSYADPDDINNDGISGRAVYVDEPISNENKLARFGYKAVTASVLQQISGAYRGDMGVTNIVAQEEPCTSMQAACINKAEQEKDDRENGLDLSKLSLAQVEFYNRLLAVPQRRGYNAQTNTWNADVLTGRELFHQAQCISCHVPRHKTGQAEGSLLGDAGLLDISDTSTPIAALSEQVIYPYTDLLLHDMGGHCPEITREDDEGNSCLSGSQCYWVQKCEGLADDRPEGSATGTEWKTPALWGLGLVQTVNPNATFLHDGRARTITEAILWHDGEAKAAKQNFVALSKAERTQLLTFLESL